MQKYFDIEFWRRVTYVDVTLWLMRAGVIIVVVWGTVETMLTQCDFCPVL